MMTVPLRKSTASGSSKATLTSSLNELRDIVRALEGKPPAVLTEGFEQSPNVDEPTDPLAQKNARADQKPQLSREAETGHWYSTTQQQQQNGL